MVCYSHLFKNFPQFVVIHTVKDFSVVNETETDSPLRKQTYSYQRRKTVGAGGEVGADKLEV